MHRRRFLESTGIAAVSAILPPITGLAFASDTLEPFQWSTDGLTFSFEVIAGKLRQKQLVPADVVAVPKSSGVEVALQCSGENSPDQGMKSGMGQPGVRLLFSGKREVSVRGGKRLVCTHSDASSRGIRLSKLRWAFSRSPVLASYQRRKLSCRY